MAPALGPYDACHGNQHEFSNSGYVTLLMPENGP